MYRRYFQEQNKRVKVYFLSSMQHQYEMDVIRSDIMRWYCVWQQPYGLIETSLASIQIVFMKFFGRFYRKFSVVPQNTRTFNIWFKTLYANQQSNMHTNIIAWYGINRKKKFRFNMVLTRTRCDVCKWMLKLPQEQCDQFLTNSIVHQISHNLLVNNNYYFYSNNIHNMYA